MRSKFWPAYLYMASSAAFFLTALLGGSIINVFLGTSCMALGVKKKKDIEKEETEQ